MKRMLFTAALCCFALFASRAALAQVQAPEVVKADDCCAACCCSVGYSVYADVTWVHLDTYGTEGIFNEGIDSEDGIRIQVGAENCDGMGIRFRYFNIDTTDAIVGADLDGLDLEYFDIELTQSFCICSIDATLSAGYRNASYDAYTEDAPNAPDEALDLDGLTFGLEVERPVSCNWAIYSSLRHSLLYGDDNGGNDQEDTLMGWTEAQLAAQYCGCCLGRETVIRFGVEAHRHEGGFDNDTSDTGLIGWFLSAGTTF